MKTKICTSPEQSKKLLELGIDINTADMHHVLIDSDKEIYDIGLGNYIGILPHYPAWSLSALLGVLSSATLDSSNDHYYRLRCMERYTQWHNNAVDACFEMVVWLLEKGYIKKGE